MRYYLKDNVWEAALKRINFLFDEFDDIVVSISGGKDSTVIFELAMMIAKERNRLPLKVMWIDQEAEWTHTYNYVREVMYRSDVKPYWYQMPIEIENSATFSETFHTCWAPGKPWLREKDPISIHENNTGVLKWIDGIFSAIDAVMFPDNTKKVAYLAGVRAEESPSRLLAISTSLTYKHITWAKSLNGKNKTHITFYPIYDWSYTDVWKAIVDNGWKYNPVYDLMYQYGTPIQKMRVSNLHHETAVSSLFYLQEFDAVLYNRMTEIMNGVDTAAKAGYDDFFVTELPFMFNTWKEYGEHLLENLVTDEKLRKSLEAQWRMAEKKCMGDAKMLEIAGKTWAKAIVVGDINGTKMDNLRNTKLRFHERKTLQRQAEGQA